MPKKISEVFGVSGEALEKEGAFNGFIDIDSKFYVDPHLLETTKVPELGNSYQRFKDHFKEVIHLLQATKNSGDRFFRAAQKRLIFPELPFVSLGYSAESTSGSGIGSGIAQNLTNTAWEIIQTGITDPVIFELVGLIEENIGADRISDMVIYIIVLDLLAYSERVAKNLNLSTFHAKARGKEFLLPAVSGSHRPTILIPNEILNDLPVAYGWDDIDRVCAHNEDLRNRVNEIIGDSWKDATRKRITKRELKYILLHYPELLQDLVEQYKGKPAEKYDFEKDSSGQLIWYEIAKEYAELFPLPLSVESGITSENILQVVVKICNHFKTLVESNGLSVTFWNDSGQLRNGRFAQLLLFGIADAYCCANNLDLNREPNAGRGPVDFKISRGYNARVNVEVKYTSNNIRSGYEKQLPIYNAAERTFHSIFLIIITTESTRALDELIKFRRSEISGGKRAPEIIVVDGRIRPSASKVK
ncbi:hypothetical protein SAMD00079811_74060 [Scytonema sp. HK-05]|uniref:hypothetical protein n=1 Tax=Scytonema sp. HK-05 TaxID=1137095 RepID=UPI000935F1A3|nr:hypothetical protein [Scytonema sp. HK-05]OKH53314.1 hypothetical protein NIES2130_30620 [Scytonema sp. HK-05]BAY49777.1 hypothetical protein SAMD00079811_74060 [Scytonema sp. HK-05]